MTTLWRVDDYLKTVSPVEFMETVTLSLEGANNVFDALERPPAPNQKLLDAANRYKEKGGFYYDGDVSSRQENT